MPDAVSRTYYAVMHAAKAALALHNVRPRSHSAVANRFGLNIVRAGSGGRALGKRIWLARFDTHIC